jgi:HSP20 family protein
MTLARLNHNHFWLDPFRDVFPLMRELFPQEEQAPTWAPPVDVVETASGVELQADLPGIAQEDIKLSVEKGVLTIHAERKAPATAEGVTRSCAERPYGVFERTFTLGEQLDPEKIEAHYEAGVLRVTVAKKPETQPRRIAVAVK